MPQIPQPALLSLQALLRRLEYPLGTTGPLNDGVDGEWGELTEDALDTFIHRLPAETWRPYAYSPPQVSRPAPIVPAVPRVGAIPKQYDWLVAMGNQMPRTIWCALKDYGVKEVSGTGNNPVILGWAAEVGLERVYTADATPFCGLWMAVIVKRSGRDPVKDPLWALNWAKFGEPAGQPSLGDVLVFTRDGGGHVGFYVAEDATHYHVLGGNTSDQVMIARIEKKRLHAARSPVYVNQPESVRPYVVNPTGETSVNEA